MLLPLWVVKMSPEAIVAAAASLEAVALPPGSSRFGPTASAVWTARSQLFRISISEPMTLSVAGAYPPGLRGLSTVSTVLLSTR